MEHFCSRHSFSYSVYQGEQRSSICFTDNGMLHCSKVMSDAILMENNLVVSVTLLTDQCTSY